MQWGKTFYLRYSNIEIGGRRNCGGFPQVPSQVLYRTTSIILDGCNPADKNWLPGHTGNNNLMKTKELCVLYDIKWNVHI